ncbi:MAG: hypothetical protein ACFCVH_16810 [Alphaproteobacteria bacterium]
MDAMIRSCVVLAAIATTAAGGCVSRDNYAKDVGSFVGQPIDAVVLAHGPPDSSFQLADGSWVFEWEEISIDRRPEFHTFHDRYYVQTGDGRFVPVHRPSLFGSEVEEITRICTTRFTTSEARQVQQVTFEGDGCRS